MLRQGGVSTGLQALRAKIRLPWAQSCSPHWGPQGQGKRRSWAVNTLLITELLSEVLQGPEEAAGRPLQPPTMPAAPPLRNSNMTAFRVSEAPEQGVWGQPAPG